MRGPWWAWFISPRLTVGRLVVLAKEVAMESSQLVVGVLFIPVVLQILLPLAILVVFFFLRLLAPAIPTAALKKLADASQSFAPQPQKF